MDFLTDPFRLAFVQRGLLELLLLSVGAGLLGTWVVLRGLAFYTHAVGTAAFPGLVVADGLGFAPAYGALGAAILFAASVGGLTRTRRSGYDSVTALVLTGALALGVILASDVFHSGSNVETLLFGSLLVLEPRDLVLAAVASALSLVATLIVGRIWLASGFDHRAAQALGLRSALPEALLFLLISLLVVASLSAVGALLAATILVVPAATVRLYAKRLPAWQLGAIGLTVVEASAGLWLSVKLNAPPGATIAVLSGGTFAALALARPLLRSRRRARLVAALAVVAAVTLSACGGSASSSSGKPALVATTTQIGDWVREVGGDSVDVHQILKANSDPHDYEPRPADVEAASGARLVFTNGDNLDGWSKKLVREAGGSPQVVDLGERIPAKIPGESGGPEGSRYDPHWWHDPRNAEAAVRKIRDALVGANPQRKVTYERNAASYLRKLEALDREIAACVGGIPRRERKLVTDHDAVGYFARRYGIDVVGAVIPSQTTQAQASAGDVARLTRLIEREGVRAVFPENSINPKLARAIAKQTGASSELTLYGDTLGPPDSPAGTYLKMEAANAEAMARGFSAGTVKCSIAAT
jgi:zinc/manganese transport system substrate-binding protein